MDKHQVSITFENLDEKQARVILQTLRDVEHKCSKSSLIMCCEVFRCEVCHRRHLNSEHSPISVVFWNYLSVASNPILASMGSEGGRGENKSEKKGGKKQCDLGVDKVQQLLDRMSPSDVSRFKKRMGM